MRASKSTDLAMMMATYGLRFLVVVFTIAAAATFLHVNNYRPSKSAFHATFSSLWTGIIIFNLHFWIYQLKIYQLISLSLSLSLSFSILRILDKFVSLFLFSLFRRTNIPLVRQTMPSPGLAHDLSSETHFGSVPVTQQVRLLLIYILV